VIDSKLRKPIQSIFDGLARILITLKMTPNMITWFAFFIGMISALLIGLDSHIVAVILLWLSGLMDVLDGTVARLTGKGSLSGAYMDLILDRMVEAMVILGFAFFAPAYHIAYILFLIAVIFNFTTFVVAGALFKNTGLKSMHYDFGLAERTETFIVFTLMLLFNLYIFEILMVFNGLIFITGVVRFVKVVKNSAGING
jgi:archaetidylinositol phosphate synthase